VLVNLLMNAGQACEGAPERRIAISTRRTGDHVVLEVSDNGAGMTADVRERLFEPLFSTKAFGVGLGMPITRRIVEQHGGEVRVATAPGEGTTVSVLLPIASGVPQ
jgi:signal transduction histidine kinase